MSFSLLINEVYDDVPQSFDITAWHNFVLCDHPEYDYINYESKLIRINGRISKIGGKDNFYHLAKDSMGNNIAVLLILLLDNLKHRKIKSQNLFWGNSVKETWCILSTMEAYFFGS